MWPAGQRERRVRLTGQEPRTFAGHLGAGLAIGCVERRVNVGVFVVAALVAAAAGSHWVLDAIVHRPEMPVAGPGSAALALALWQQMPLALAVEALVAVGGLLLFLRGRTLARGRSLGRVPHGR